MELLDQLKPHDVLRMFVAELPFDAQAQWCTVGDRQVRPVEPIGEERLRVVGIVFVDALVLRHRAVVVIEGVGTMKDAATKSSSTASRHGQPIARSTSVALDESGGERSAGRRPWAVRSPVNGQ